MIYIPLIMLFSGVTNWPMMGYDLRNTARYPSAGQIRNPRLAWKMDLSASEYLLEATPESGERDRDIERESDLQPLSIQARRSWGLSAPQLDVLGDGNLINPPSAPGARWGKFIPDVSGLQRLSWTTTWGENAHFQMHSFEDGVDQPRLVWDITFDGAMYAPLVAVVDVDGDGTLEAVLSMWHGVIVYDLSTGREKHKCQYRQTHGRQYGFLGTHVGPSGSAYIVVIGDFAGHIGILSVRDGELKNLWYHRFDPQSEQGIDRRFTINTIGPDPMGDFDGDGHGEVLMNVFNETGDGRWHLIAYDVETGEHRLDLPEVYLHGHVGNKLLTQHCHSRPVGTNGEIRLYGWDKLLWNHPYARWSMAKLPQLPLTHITGATRGMEAPVWMASEDDGMQVAFFTAKEDDERETLHALSVDPEDRVETAWKVGGSPGTLIDAAAASGGKVLIQMRADRDAAVKLHADGVQVQPIARQRITRGAPQPLVLRDAQDRPQIIVAEPLDCISGYAVQAEGDQPLCRIWRRPGRAMTTQVPQMLGLVAGDVDQDGLDEVLYVREAREGHSRLVASGLDGHERWHYDFPGFNGRAPVWNECGTTIWAVGHFTDPKSLDLMVSNRRSIMHSDETVVLNPRKDCVVWHRDILEVRSPWTDTPWPHTRGYGGGKVATADIDGDGADEIVLCYPAEYSVVRGKSGEQYIVENTGPLKGTNNFWVFGGRPLVADLDGDGSLETLSTSSSMILAFAHQEGCAEILWRTEPNDGASGFPAIGDTDGDGHPKIGLPGFKDGFRCLDTATGEVLWVVPSQSNSVSNCIALDINGDGIEEFLYANGNRLLAVARRPDVEDAIIWQMDLPVPVQNIAVADVDGDDELEILAGGSDGILYCVK